MANITASDVKELRQKTGAGVLDAKRALDEANGDIQEAITLLQKRGAKIAAKKADRDAMEGIIETYIHAGGRVGVMLELNCETDFVARNDDFKELAHDLAIHIAAMAPSVINAEDVPEDEVTKQKEIINAQLKEEGKPENMWDKIGEGKIDKFRKEQALLSQAFVKDPSQTVGERITQAIGTIGENIRVGRFARFDIKGNPNVCENLFPAPSEE